MDISLPTEPTTTESIVSTWAGRPVQNVDRPEEALRVGENRTLPDVHDITKRLFFYPFSSTSNDQSYPITSSAQLSCYSPLSLMRTNNALNAIRVMYDAFAYDFMHITCSLSAPKGACGSVYVGYYPYAPWFQSFTLTQEAQRHAAGFPNITRMLLSPECHLMSISDSQDIKFSIPWTFATSFLKQLDHPTSTSVGVYGNPVIYIYVDRLSYLSSITLPPLMKMTVQFENLRFYGPSYLEDSVQLQSGMEVAAATALSGVVSSVVSNAIGETFDSVSEFVDFDPEPDEGYGRPMPVQPSFAGDTTGIGPPLETPIFAPRPFSKPSKHRVIDYLKRPQLFKSGNLTSSPTTFNLVANPTDPNYDTFPNGTNTAATYFRWFAQGAQYWRGTISFYVVIFGHPMVEVQHNIVMDYPGGTSDVSAADPGDWITLRGISSGTHTIKIPMPFMSYCDMIPVYDSLVNGDKNMLFAKSSSSFVNITLKVISTMLDVSPTIPYSVYVAAEDDFCFYQPFSPGLNYTEPAAYFASSLPDQKQNDFSNTVKVELQVGIPVPSEVFQTRAVPCTPLEYLLPFVHVEDYMEIWSRCLPFTSYDSNDEPVPNAIYMADPCFWPLTGGSAAWTPDVNNSWYVCNDYISLFSSHYLYYTGSIGVKVICATDDSTSGPTYKYISLFPMSFPRRQPVNNPFTFLPSDLPFTANLGNGTTLTPVSLQPVLECVLPYRSVLPWTAVVPHHLDRNVGEYSGQLSEDTVVQIDTSVVVQGSDGNLKDALYRKKGRDYFVSVEGLLPPGLLWVAKGFDWTS